MFYCPMLRFKSFLFSINKQVNSTVIPKSCILFVFNKYVIDYQCWFYLLYSTILFQVRCKAEATLTFMDNHVKEAQVPSNKLTHQFGHLHPATKYICSVAASTRSGLGTAANRVVWTQSSGKHKIKQYMFLTAISYYKLKQFLNLTK